jgi:hypothetical protein
MKTLDLVQIMSISLFVEWFLLFVSCHIITRERAQFEVIFQPVLQTPVFVVARFLLEKGQHKAWVYKSCQGVLVQFHTQLWPGSDEFKSFKPSGTGSSDGICELKGTSALERCRFPAEGLWSLQLSSSAGL